MKKRLSYNFFSFYIIFRLLVLLTVAVDINCMLLNVYLITDIQREYKPICLYRLIVVTRISFKIIKLNI